MIEFLWLNLVAVLEVDAKFMMAGNWVWAQTMSVTINLLAEPFVVPINAIIPKFITHRIHLHRYIWYIYVP